MELGKISLSKYPLGRGISEQLMNKLFPLLITSLLFSQINVKNQRMNNIQDALFMERKGELENAKIIYEKLEK